MVAAAQVPLPSQVRFEDSAVPTHMAGAHSVPVAYLRQAPWPSHIPSRRQVLTGSVAHSLSGSSLSGTSVQVPTLPAMSHALQVPVQVESQHTPSVQKPDSHCVREAHFCPLAAGWTRPASIFGGGVLFG